MGDRHMAEGWRCIVRSVVVGTLLLSMHVAVAEVYVAGPGDYRRWLESLEPGDTLRLRPGDYRRGLPVRNLRGRSGARIRIAGPKEGPAAVFHAREGSNVVSILNSEWITIQDLTIDGHGLPVDGVKLEGHAGFGHHITISGLVIRGLSRHQQVVGISTKAPARGWVVRGNRIDGAGTGMYFGDSDGSAPFVGGVIEHNLVTDTTGYALQIKHQHPRPEGRGLPQGQSRTVIRHNVFAKGVRSSDGATARPSVLLGHFPSRGPGSDDVYAVYGNFFFNNPSERLFQGEGDIALYSNVFVNRHGSAVAFMPHKGHTRRIRFFHNTILARGSGVWLKTTERTRRVVIAGNAVFAAQPLAGTAPDHARMNVTSGYEAAARRLRAPFAPAGALNLLPRGATLTGPALWADGPPKGLPDVDRDFEGYPRDGRHRGAYVGGREGPAWFPDLEAKPPEAMPP